MLDLASTQMIRDGLTLDEARRQAEEVKEAIQQVIMSGEDPEEVLLDLCGLEPDYLEEQLDY